MAKKQNDNLPTVLSVQDIFKDVLKRDPMHFVENVRTVKGQNFQIINTGRDYLREVYNYICFEALKAKKPVVVVKGRQVEFTETMLNICLYYLYHHKNLTILYAFPSGDQVSRFSSDRFDGAIRESQNEVLKNIFMPGGKQNVHHKQFRGNSQIFMYSAWGEANTLRGVACDVLVKDEVQDWTTAGIQNTQEAMVQSRFKVDLSLGTPKEEGTYYHELWRKSDQRYFHVRCVSCANLFIITLETCTTETLIRCPECEYEQEKRDAIVKGEWKSTVPNPEKTDNVGFHLSQLIHPLLRIEDIHKKKRDYGERRFKNEVLGEFTGSMDRMISPQQILNMIDSEGWNQPEWDYPLNISPPEETVMGIDWGGHSADKPHGSYNALIIAKPITSAKYQIVYTKKLTFSNYKDQVDEIVGLIYRYNCQKIVADQGYGHVQIQMLQEKFGAKVTACMYQSNLKAQYKFDTDTNIISVDKDYALEELFQEILRQQWIIPLMTSGRLVGNPDEAESDTYEWLIHHLCNIEMKDIAIGGNTRKSFQKINRPCDGLHALNYVRLAMIIKGHIIKQHAMAMGTFAPLPVLARFGRR